MPEVNEKKVEYLELIYDLIFVYLIGRNNSILHSVEGGFVPWRTFFSYILCTLAVIQIWNFSTFYINLYGRNGLRDHIFLFINMYLLYHLADGISTGWMESFYQFCSAWLLILVNIGIQHIIEMRNHKGAPWITAQLRRKSAILFEEAALVAVHMIFYYFTGESIAYIPILFGMIATLLSGRVNMMVPVDFGHLSERAMLYVVFTFGEMIISITGYFSGRITAGSIYYSGMAFLIVVGLFLSYEIFYNYIIDREAATNGTVYMMIHVFLIFALNNISVALEFMREEEVALLPKIIFIGGSFILYFIFLFLIGIFAKKGCSFNIGFFIIVTAFSMIFLALMILFSKFMIINILVSVLYIFMLFIIIYRHGKRM